MDHEQESADSSSKDSIAAQTGEMSVDGNIVSSKNVTVQRADGEQIVQASGEGARAEINIHEGNESAGLPNTRLWRYVLAGGAIIAVLGIASVIGDTVGVYYDRFFPKPTPVPTATPILFAPGEEDETLVVIADFLNPLGVDDRDLTHDLYERIRAELASHPNIRVERLHQAILKEKGSDVASETGSREDISAKIVIWGHYVSPPGAEVTLNFDILKRTAGYLASGVHQRFGPQDIQPQAVSQPSLFEFKYDLGSQLGGLVAFASALALFNAGEHLDAVPLFNTSHNLAFNTEPKTTAAIVPVSFEQVLYFYRGSNYLYLGRAMDALPDFERIATEESLNALSQEGLLSSVLNNIGWLHGDLGEMQQAVDYYEQMLVISRKSGDRWSEGSALGNLGIAYRDLGRVEEAIEYFQQALVIAREIGDRLGRS